MPTSEKVAHTPGPWEVAEGHGRLSIIHPLNEQDCEQVVDLCGYMTPEIRADARLIAAAPDLLAALEGMSDAVVGHDLHCFEGDFREAVLNVRAAIAKARGA